MYAVIVEVLRPAVVLAGFACIALSAATARGDMLLTCTAFLVTAALALGSEAARRLASASLPMLATALVLYLAGSDAYTEAASLPALLSIVALIADIAGLTAKSGGRG